jgi:biotin-dependent carboxylase-like uncharacterized protein
MSVEIEVERPGALATIQDLGRPGLGRFGVSPSGALDPLSLRLANRLVGNAEGAAALELTGPGAALRFSAAALCALGGGDLGARLDGRAIPPARAFVVRAGGRLELTARARGGRVVLAVAGGLEAPLAFGSAATDLAGGLGPHGGARLARGARLVAPGVPREPPPRPDAARLAALLRDAYEGARPSLLRVVLEDDPDLHPDATARLLGATFRVSPRANRAAFQLETSPPLPTAAAGGRPDRLSEGIAPGAIQLPPDGRPLLLLADRNTVGGYPCLGHLAAVDRPRAAQLLPGDEVRFAEVAVADAHRLLAAREALLSAVFT